jgi:MOSC domain-containing protein YiiM
MNDLGFVKKFRQARRPGLYCRVIKEGLVQASDEVILEPNATEHLTVLETFEMYYDPNPSLEMIERILAAPVAIRARKMYEPMLEKAKSSLQATD